MSEEEIKKTFSRIELDKTSDSCGFEFADGYGCTFDNIAICYDDRLKLYELVKKLQQENLQLKEVIETLKNTNVLLIKQKYQLEKDLDNESNKIEKAIEYANQSIKYPVSLNSYKLLEILKGDRL